MNQHRMTPSLTAFRVISAFVGVLIAVLLIIYADNVIDDIRGDVTGLAEKYEDIRADRADLCSDDENADKPECKADPPSAEKVVEDEAPVAAPVPGPRGPGPTDAQVRDATASLLPLFVGPGIVEFCDGGRCRGKDGEDSTVPGPMGPMGPMGPGGQDGRNMVDARCDGTTGVLIFDRGDPIRVEGMCPEDPEPPPEDPPGEDADGRVVD